MGGPMQPETIKLPQQLRAAAPRLSTLNEETRTVDITWTTGAAVRRLAFHRGKVVEVEEVLSLDEGAADLTRLNSGAPLLDTHSSSSLDDIIGVVESARIEGENGSRVGVASVRFDGGERGRRAFEMVRDRTIRNVSVGYWINEAKLEERDGAMPVLRATSWEPAEISLVPVPADPGAQVRGGGALFERAARIFIPSMEETAVADETTQAAVAATEERKAPEQEQRKPLDLSVPQLDPDQIAREARQVAAEISRLCRKHRMSEEITDELLDAGDLAAAQKRILAELEARSAASPPRIGHAEITRDANETAHMLAEQALEYKIGLRSGDQLEEAARPFVGMRMVEIGRELARRNNVTTLGGSVEEVASNILRRGYGGHWDISYRAGPGAHSSSDFPKLVENIMSKTLRGAYAATSNTFAQWATRDTLPDFKEASLVQVGEAPGLLEVGEGAEYKFGTVGEGREKWRVYKFGRMIKFTMELLINDDTRALRRMPGAFGEAAADLEGDAVYYQLMKNAALQNDGIALFHASHNNLGTTAAISNTTLEELWELMTLQTGLSGERVISVRPRWLLVPPAIYHTALQYTNPQMFSPTTLAETPTAITTIWTAVPEHRLQTGVTYRGDTVAGSSTAYYGIGEGPGVEHVVYGYLAGAETPRTETRDGWYVDGVEMKVSHTFGAKAVDFRGLVKNAGA